MFPHRSLILAILRVAIFSIEVPERELSKEQYAIELAAEVAYCFKLNSLSGTKVLKMATKELPEFKRPVGDFILHFFIYMATLFLLLFVGFICDLNESQKRHTNVFAFF